MPWLQHVFVTQTWLAMQSPEVVHGGNELQAEFPFKSVQSASPSAVGTQAHPRPEEQFTG